MKVGNRIEVIYIIILIAIEINGYNLDLLRFRRQTECGFRCQSGECIDEDKECDGISDCKDESDETNACQRINCPSYTFECKYGACIDADSECNGKKDCRDNSDETSPKCKKNSNNKCGPEQFQCKSGQCIHEDNKCDGTVQCDDQSDETEQTCLGIRCPGFTYRCAYGACVNGNSECNGEKECFDGSDEDPNKCPSSVITTPTPAPPPVTPPLPPARPETPGKCVLPQHPTFGQWNVAGPISDFNPGDSVDPNTIVVLSCKKKFKLEGNAHAYCKNGGVWSNSLGVCSPLCEPYKNTPVMSVTCTLRGQVIDCNEPVVGTIANFSCIDHYEDPGLNTFPYRECIDGDWDRYPPSCNPVCGVKSVYAEPLIIAGSPVRKGDYPWQIALYEKKPGSNTNKLICGGSLINPKIVLTAAHCVTDQRSGALKSKDLYSVAAGKYYRNYSDPRDIDEAQFLTIKVIYISPQYKGPDQNFVGDLALLITVKPFILSKRVQPVCLDRNKIFHDKLLNPSNKGLVTGWGFTKENEAPSDELKYIKVPYVLTDECQQQIPEDYHIFITYDKMCAGYVNQSSAVCKGDSGGGLVFKNPIDGRYYVEGIVSISPRAPEGGCDSQNYALYTQVHQHIAFILDKEKIR